MKKSFYGWWIVAGAFLTFGLSVGVPYYNISFFYDYFAKNFHWTKAQITFGFPLAAIPTIIIGPMLIHRFSPRKLIVVGTGLTGLALFSFGAMGGNLWVYWGIWFIYMAGYIFSGPIPHQIIVSQWFRKLRGTAMGIVYVGVGLVGFLGSYLVKPMAENLGFQTALMIMGGMLLLAWPVAIFFIRDRPADKGLYPDGASTPPAEIKARSHNFKELLSHYPFWLLLLGSFCSIGSIGAVNFHMKFVFEDQMAPSIARGSPEFQALLNSTWRAASMIILASSIVGRLAVGGLADLLSKKWVMTATYFIVAATIPIMLISMPPDTPWAFALLFGLGMGADYMLIPLMAAEQFGVNSLARCMAVILPVNTIGQTWFPYAVSLIRERYGNYTIAMGTVFTVAMIGAISVLVLPRRPRPEQMLAAGPPAKA
jgi:MFS family permease